MGKETTYKVWGGGANLGNWGGGNPKDRGGGACMYKNALLCLNQTYREREILEHKRMPPADSKCAEESVVANSEHYMSVSVAMEHRLEADGEAVHNVQLVCQMSDDDVKTFNFNLVLTERNSLFWLFQPSAIWQPDPNATAVKTTKAVTRTYGITVGTATTAFTSTAPQRR